jgi:ribosomal protein S18 acetylase RimI-like enzyme
MVSADNFETGRKLIDNISECDLIVAHEKHMADYISDRFGLTERLECFQTAYMSKIKLDIKEELEIRQLNQDQTEVISEHYDKLSGDEIRTLLKNGNLFGGYKDGTLVGFIGNHLEGSIGILEVFPQYRRLGYGTVLVSYMVNQMLEKDLMPFAQAEVDNEKSLSMQKKLGFSISKDSLFWIY